MQLGITRVPATQAPPVSKLTHGLVTLSGDARTRTVADRDRLSVGRVEHFESAQQRLLQNLFQSVCTGFILVNMTDEHDGLAQDGLPILRLEM